MARPAGRHRSLADPDSRQGAGEHTFTTSGCRSPAEVPLANCCLRRAGSFDGMQDGEGIRKSPYEEGLYFVQPERGTTLQDHSTQWQASAARCSTGFPPGPPPAQQHARSAQSALFCTNPNRECEQYAGLSRPRLARHACPSSSAPRDHPSPLPATWQVGVRYSLHRILGYGSYSAVCLALDHTTGEKVGCSCRGPGQGCGQEAQAAAAAAAASPGSTPRRRTGAAAAGHPTALALCDPSPRCARWR